MKKLIPIGAEDFAAIRAKSSYYVDKTQMLYDLLHTRDNAMSSAELLQAATNTSA